MPSEIGAPFVGTEGSEGVEDIEEATHKDAAHKEDVELPEDLHAQRALAVYLGTG